LNQEHCSRLHAARMVRMEESSFRQVWRLTNLRIKDRVLEVVPPGNEGISNDIIENKGIKKPSAGISYDLIENKPLKLLNPSILLKIKELYETSTAARPRASSPARSKRWCRRGPDAYALRGK
jgi:hypothetical protein